MASNVILIDPNNDVNINPNIVNGIPQYQDMHIFTELIATRKGRTVLVSQGELNTYNVEKTDLENTTVVNFLGNNQNTNSPNYLNFTTNYYDGSSGNDVQYEGFGMTSIKVVINASFVPQVNIQFVDIRGLAFFNRENSPYRILFDFPPPIFNLTINGYYGKALSYQLHLVKYTSEFKAENGNYVIDAQFVAITFAPLSDVLLRYIINFPLINNLKSMNPQVGIKPTNTFELITKLKNLYSAVSEEINTLLETSTYDNNLKQIINNNEAFSMLENYKNDLKGQQLSYSVIIDTSPTSVGITQSIAIKDGNMSELPNNILNYDTTIKEYSIDTKPSQINKRLYIVYVIGEIIPPILSSGLPRYDELSATLLNLKTKLMSTTGAADASIENNDISNPIPINNKYNIMSKKISEENLTKYIGIDVTDYYWILYKKKINLNESKTETSKTINVKINNMITKNLGMSPTIYNIFDVILKDVDNFFQKVRDVSWDAEENHHKTYKPAIINSDTNFPDTNKEKIFAFPLFVNRKAVLCGGNREERIAPIELSKSLEPHPFPEMVLVNEFIDTFFQQRKFTEQLNLKGALNADGSYKWIPISPFDSKLGFSNIASPYFDIDTPNITPISNDYKSIEAFKIVLKRFYILSQSSIPTNFYGNDYNSYTTLYGKSEAINLSLSITNSDYGKNLKTLASKYSTNVNLFYDFIKNVPDYYFVDNTKTFFTISGTVSGKTDAYVNKTNKDYMGFEMYNNNKINIQDLSTEPDTPIGNFYKTINNNKMLDIISGKIYLKSSYGFTDTNIIYAFDKPKQVVNDIVDVNSNNLESLYLGGVGNITNYGNEISCGGETRTSKLEAIRTLLDDGNWGFTIKLGANRNLMLLANSIIPIWVDQLSKYDTILCDSVFNTKSKLGALICLSNFGYTLSPFNIFPKNLNDIIFNTPAVVSVPTYLPAYMGALVDAIKENDSDFTETTIYDFFTTGVGKVLDSSGLFIFADIHDIKNFLSTKDQENFRLIFIDFYDNYYETIRTKIQSLYNNVKNVTNKKEIYDYHLNPNNKEADFATQAGDYYSDIIQPLIERKKALINFSEITFSNKTQIPTAYRSLKSLNDDKTKNYKDINDAYFKAFFTELLKQISANEKKLLELEEENKNFKNDIDIVTQTYYSFKNVNDKWLTGPKIADVRGYPFNDKNKNLIDSFAFVDRAMNPIGDTIINAEILLEMLEDTNISVFTALTQLLSLNGFEFFPLQNFISYKDTNEESWKDSFRIDMSGDVKQSPAYICMLVAGTSSYPTGGGNGFQDDGIIDINNAPTDFSTSICNPVPDNDNQVAKNPDFPFKTVRAFRVRFGEQNQSMFTDIKIESKEYPDTNESIQILARLAGDNKIQAPVPKGQNLYNLYENRAYRATITGLGNAMIQPTQYFQLENVPLFNGAYLILSVEHTIEPNKMTTNFSGTKLSRYPVPRVMNPAAIYGYDGGISDLSPGAAVVVAGTQATTMSQTRLTELNSVFGIDVSAVGQGNFDWEKAVVNDPDPETPKLKFALMKITQGPTFIDPQGSANATAAKNVGLKIGYYHYAQQCFNPDSDFIVADAKAQAANFISIAQSLPKPDFPLMLDMENYTDKDKPHRYWSKIKTNNDLWINTFIAELKKANYDTVIYSGQPWLDEYTTSNFGSIPLWHSQWPKKPEQTNPTVAKAWQKGEEQNWSVWQFSSEGVINGNKRNNVDLNAMKESFFNKYNA